MLLFIRIWHFQSNLQVNISIPFSGFTTIYLTWNPECKKNRMFFGKRKEALKKEILILLKS